MTDKDEGFTVGELIIAISILLIIFLAWSGLTKKQETQSRYYQNNDYYSVVKS